MNLYDNIHFEGKHEDEKILHFCRPASMQLKYELFKLTFPIFCIAAIFIALYVFDIILSFFIIISILIALIVLSTFSIFYKIYRSKNNYLYITSKRVLFH